MILTASTTRADFGEALRTYAMQESREAIGEESYACAFGSLLHVLQSITRNNRKALKELNKIIAAQTPAAAAGDACGDINCDGQCHVAPAEKPAHPPALIQLIDVSPTVNDARIATAKATTASLRAAARFLRTDMHSLPAVITRRVSERLAKAAA